MLLRLIALLISSYLKVDKGQMNLPFINLNHMTAFLFLLGLVVGSFLNSVIYRLDTGESIIKSRSHCPDCKKTLSWLELIPLMSFIFQRGKCRHCKKPISWQYPLVELATGLLFSLCFLYFPQNLMISVVYCLFAGFLIIIFVYDLKHYIIPNEVIYPAIIVAGIWCIVSGILTTFFAAIAAGAFFLAIVLISRGKWMGMGDVKLVFFMGLVLGWPNIFVALFFAFLIGAAISVILLAFKKKTLKSEIPFGPFLVGATILTIFFGNIFINWYLNLLFL